MKKILLPAFCFFFLIQNISSHGLPGKNSAISFSAVRLDDPLYTAMGVTVAGGNGSGSAENQLSFPYHSFVDKNGNIYVSDGLNDRVQKWAPGALAGVTVAGGNGRGSAANQFNGIAGISVDTNGNIYVSDRFNHRIQKWVPGASAGITVAGGNGAGSANNQLNEPAGIFVDAYLQIYIADRNNHRIQLWGSGATSGYSAAGGHGSGNEYNQLKNPNDVCVYRGTMYIADMGNNRIHRWSLGFSYGIPYHFYINSPSGIAIDADENIYIVERNTHSILKWPPFSSSPTTLVGGQAGPGASQLSSPYSVFVDANLNLYVTDFGNHRIQKWAPTAMESDNTVAGGNGQGSANNQLNMPLDVFVDPSGNIYIADANNQRIQKWAPGASAGITMARNLSLTSRLQPNSIFVDASGNMYISDGYSHSILKWAPGASSGITVAGGNGAGSAANQLYNPYGIFVDAIGNIYITDGSNQRIQKWPPGASQGITVAGGNGQGRLPHQLDFPIDVFVDASGNIFIADPGSYRVQKWAPGASAGVTVAGGYVEGTSPDVTPLSIFVDSAGNIYFSDVNNRIQKWVPGASRGVTVAGGNGSGTAANQFREPNGLFVDPSGNIYVADRYNDRIQKFPALSLNPGSIECPPDQTITLTSCNDKVRIGWSIPTNRFPDTISIKKGVNLSSAKLIYKGSLNEHGYYVSDDEYNWKDARDAANSVGAHLATITSATENNVVNGYINEPFNYTWIGMYNTGSAGSFAWVTGEAVNYTNWMPDEPNNLYYDRATPVVFEPYVHIHGWDPLTRWNDIGRDIHARFLAEFDRPLFTRRQISGPLNGTEQPPGEYKVCYERTNFYYKKDTCCFTIKVTCNAALAGSPSEAALASKNGLNESLQVFTSPNPTKNYFKLQTVSRNSDQVRIEISDATGRILETMNRQAPNQTVELGKNLRPGIYFIKVTQKTSKVVVKVIKQ